MNQGFQKFTLQSFIGWFILSMLMLSSAHAAPDWFQWQADNGRTATVYAESAIEDAGISWRRVVGGSGSGQLLDVDGDGVTELLMITGGRPVLRKLDGSLVWDREPSGVGGCSSVPRLDGQAGTDLLCKGGRVVWLLNGRTGVSIWELPGDLVETVGTTWFGGPVGDPHLMVSDLATGMPGDGSLHLFRLSGTDMETPILSIGSEDRDYPSGATVAVIVDQNEKPAELAVAGDHYIYIYSAVDGTLKESIEIPGKIPSGEARLFVYDNGADSLKDLILIRNFNRPGQHFNSVSRIERNGSGSSEAFRREWASATVQQCPRTPIFKDGRVATSVWEDGLGWRTVIVDAEDGTESSSFSGFVLSEAFNDAGDVPYLLMQAVSKGEVDPINESWLLRGSEPMKNLGARVLMPGSLLSNPTSGVGKLDPALAELESLAFQVIYPPDPVPVAIELLDLATLDLMSTITPTLKGTGISLDTTGSVHFLVTELSGKLRVYDQAGQAINAPVQGVDPASYIGGFFPRQLRYGAQITGESVLVVEGAKKGIQGFLGDAAGPASVLYTRVSSHAELGRGTAQDVLGVYNIRWHPDEGAALLFTEPNGNQLWSAALPEFEQTTFTRAPVLWDFDQDGVDDILLLLVDLLSDNYHLVLVSGMDGSRIADGLVMNFATTSIRALSLLPGTPPRALIKDIYTLYAVEIHDGEMVISTTMDPGQVYGFPIVLKNESSSGVRVVVGGTIEGMLGLNGDLEEVWALNFRKLSSAFMAVPETASGPVAVASVSGVPGLVGVDVDTGTILWTTGLIGGESYLLNSSEVEASSVRLVSVTALVGTAGATAFTGSSDGYVYGVDAETGDLRFSLYVGGGVGEVIPADVDGDEKMELLATVSDGSVVAIDNADIPAPGLLAELPPDDLSVVDPAEDVDLQESAETVRLAFSPVEDALGYELRLFSENGTQITQPQFIQKTETQFEQLNLPLEAFVYAEVRSLGEEAFSKPIKSDGVTVRDMSGPTIGDILIDGVETDGLVPNESSVVMSVQMEDRTRLGEISLVVTISRDGTQLAKAVDMVMSSSRNLKLKVPLGDLAVDEQIRVEAQAADLAEHKTERTWVLRIVDPDAVEEEQVAEEKEPVEREERAEKEEATNGDRNSDERGEEVVEDEEGSSGGSSSCQLSLWGDAPGSHFYLLIWVFLLLFYRRRESESRL